jgi:hypothetical protein
MAAPVAYAVNLYTHICANALLRGASDTVPSATCLCRAEDDANALADGRKRAREMQRNYMYCPVAKGGWPRFPNAPCY